jgi:hypothetical protein
MIEQPSKEADELHDIMAKQRHSAGYEQLKKELLVDAAKLAMWPELVQALNDLKVAFVFANIGDMAIAKPVIDSVDAVLKRALEAK